MKKNVLIGIGIVVVGIIIIVGLYIWLLGPKNNLATNQGPGLVTNVPIQQLPPGFLASTPFFGQMLVEQNFTVSDAATLQSTRKYLSSVPMDQLFQNYKSFFMQEGWKLSDFSMNNIVDDGVGFSGIKGDTELMLHLNYNTSTVPGSTFTDAEISYTSAQ